MFCRFSEWFSVFCGYYFWKLDVIYIWGIESGLIFFVWVRVGWYGCIGVGVGVGVGCWMWGIGIWRKLVGFV